MYFKDRQSAAQQLLLKLLKYKFDNPLVLGIPRGAIPMAKIIAEGLNAEFSALLVHKIPHPDNEEFAIGCVGLSGKTHKMPYAQDYLIPESYIETVSQLVLAQLKERQRLYGIFDLRMKKRTVIIVDDGIATGATTVCAIDEVRLGGASKVILAAPVASREAFKKLKPLVDDLVVLDVPPGFYGVAQFFASFPQVTDAEVIRLLHGEVNQESSEHL